MTHHDEQEEVRRVRLSPVFRNLRLSWRAAAISAGVPGFHVHDIGHVGLTLVASSPATEHDVPARARHARPAFTRRNMHRDFEHDRAVVDAADQLIDRLVK